MDYCRTVLLRLGAYPELGSACSERCRSDSALRLTVAPDSGQIKRATPSLCLHILLKVIGLTDQRNDLPSLFIMPAL